MTSKATLCLLALATAAAIGSARAEVSGPGRLLGGLIGTDEVRASAQSAGKLPTGCAAGQVPLWNGSTWVCGTVGGGGGGLARLEDLQGQPCNGGACSGTDATCQVTMTRARQVSAIFFPTLSVTLFTSPTARDFSRVFNICLFFDRFTDSRTRDRARCRRRRGRRRLRCRHHRRGQRLPVRAAQRHRHDLSRAGAAGAPPEAGSAGLVDARRNPDIRGVVQRRLQWHDRPHLHPGRGGHRP